MTHPSESDPPKGRVAIGNGCVIPGERERDPGSKWSIAESIATWVPAYAGTTQRELKERPQLAIAALSGLTDVRAPVLVEIRNLSKYYQRGEQIIAVLLDINLDVALGDFVALIGPSGSGKSTLLNLIAGIDKPSSGTI